MKFIKIWGGIGNQLFQYYFGQYLQQQTKDFVVYTNEFGKIQVPRKLDSFLELNFEKTRNEDGGKEKSIYFNQFYRINRKLLQLYPFFSKKIIVENLSNNFNDKMIQYDLFDGYWQDLLFIETLKNCGHFHFSFSKLNNFQSNHFYQLILATTDSVAVHIRRNDYLVSDYHKNLGLDYYNKSMEIICQKILNPVFFIFSDDILWVKNNFSLSSNIIIVNSDNDNLDFYLMSLCKHHIIANSTFSWWPAYLKNQEKSITIAPYYWYNKNNNSSKKILKREWILL